MTRFSLLSLLLLSLLFITACGGDDDGDNGADLTVDVTGTYDGQYLYQVPGEAPVSDVIAVTVTRVDNDEVRFQFAADGIDFDFTGTLTDALTFANDAITIDGDVGYSLSGAYAAGTLSLQIIDNEDADIVETFVGTKR